jgi:hypothetical protein
MQVRYSVAYSRNHRYNGSAVRSPFIAAGVDVAVNNIKKCSMLHGITTMGPFVLL